MLFFMKILWIVYVWLENVSSASCRGIIFTAQNIMVVNFRLFLVQAKFSCNQISFINEATKTKMSEWRSIDSKKNVCVYKFITFKCLKWFIATFFCYNLSTQNSDENLKHFRYQWKSKKKTTRQIFYFGTLEILSKFFLQSHSGRTILSHSKISVSILSRDPLVVVRSKFFLFNTFRRVIYWIFVPSSAMYVLCTCISIKVTVLHWIYIEIGKMADT